MAGVTRRTVLTLGLAAGTEALPSKDGDAAALQSGKSRENPILGHGGLHHTAVRTHDWDRSLAFYQTVLGFSVKMSWHEPAGTLASRLADAKATRPYHRWAYLDSGNGIYIELFEDPDFTPPPPGASDPTKYQGNTVVHFGLRTSRLDQVYDHARAHGVTVLGSPEDYTLNTTEQGPIVVRFCFIQGPSGEWIELIQNPP